MVYCGVHLRRLHSDCIENIIQIYPYGQPTSFLLFYHEFHREYRRIMHYTVINEAKSKDIRFTIDCTLCCIVEP